MLTVAYLRLRGHKVNYWAKDYVNVQPKKNAHTTSGGGTSIFAAGNHIAGAIKNGHISKSMYTIRIRSSRFPGGLNGPAKKSVLQCSHKGDFNPGLLSGSENKA